MQQYLVPQFIETEDKILGPISVRQFLELLFGALVGFLAYKMLDLGGFIIVLILDVILVGVVAFMKVNGMPFHFVFLNFVQTFKKPKIRVWYKELLESEVRAAIKKEEIERVEIAPHKEFVGSSQLSELTLMIDTGGVYEGETILEAKKASATQASPPVK